MWFNFLALILLVPSRLKPGMVELARAHIPSPGSPGSPILRHQVWGEDFVLHDRRLIRPVSCYALTYIEAGAAGAVVNRWLDERNIKVLCNNLGLDDWRDACVGAQTQNSKN